MRHVNEQKLTKEVNDLKLARREVRGDGSSRDALFFLFSFQFSVFSFSLLLFSFQSTSLSTTNTPLDGFLSQREREIYLKGFEDDR